MELLARIADQLEKGQDAAVAESTAAALAEGLPADSILNEGLIAGMNVVGEKFRTHQIFLPHVLLAARAMHAGMALLKPHLIDQNVARAGKAVLGTVRGDQHDIGKNLVGSMLEGAGFGIIDLGTDVSPQAFVESVKESGATIVAMSSLLTTTMPAMKGVLEELDKAGLRGKVRVMVGGAPLTQKVADELGADGYGSNANSAVKVARGFVGV